MYYESCPQAYAADFEKLREMINTDNESGNESVAVQIHFELYQNARQPNHRTMDRLAASLDPSSYWTQTRTIGDAAQCHFYRVAFGFK